MTISEQIPEEVLSAALLVMEWMNQHNIHDWQLAGICSRSFADKATTIRGSLQVLERLVNLSPQQMRDKLYDCSAKNVTMEMLKRHYRTRGALVAELYARYIEGEITL